MDILKEIEVTFHSPSVTCPDAAWRSDRAHHCKRIGIREAAYELIDLINGTPTIVTANVQRWRCSCGKEFYDPSCPYSGKGHASKEFANYIAQQILSDSTLTEQKLSDTYGISTRFISEALNRYMSDCKPIFQKSIRCHTVIIKQYMYDYILKLLVFGQLQDQGDVFFLGITNDSNIDEIEAIADLTSPSKIICFNEFISSLLSPFEQKIQVKSPNYPEITRITRLMDLFQSRKINFESMRLRLMFQSKFRRSEIRETRLGNTLPTVFHQICKIPSFQLPSYTYISYIDTDAVVREYGGPDFLEDKFEDWFLTCREIENLGDPPVQESGKID